MWQAPCAGIQIWPKKKKKKSKNIKSRIFRTNILVGKTCDHKTNKQYKMINDATWRTNRARIEGWLDLRKTFEWNSGAEEQTKQILAASRGDRCKVSCRVGWWFQVLAEGNDGSIGRVGLSTTMVGLTYRFLLGSCQQGWPEGLAGTFQQNLMEDVKLKKARAGELLQ